MRRQCSERRRCRRPELRRLRTRGTCPRRTAIASPAKPASTSRARGIAHRCPTSTLAATHSWRARSRCSKAARLRSAVAATLAALRERAPLVAMQLAATAPARLAILGPACAVAATARIATRAFVSTGAARNAQIRTIARRMQMLPAWTRVSPASVAARAPLAAWREPSPTRRRSANRLNYRAGRRWARAAPSRGIPGG